MRHQTREELLEFKLHHLGRAYRNLYKRLEPLAHPNDVLWEELVYHDIWREANGFEPRFQYGKHQPHMQEELQRLRKGAGAL